MVASSNLGFPRIGARRELKTALELYWSGETTLGALLETGRKIRQQNWTVQASLGLDHIPSNDFSFYDHVLDMAAVVGAVPERYRREGQAPGDLGSYFAMARGAPSGSAPLRGSRPLDLAPLRMTKWFDTNYHYIVPEFDDHQTFRAEWTKPVDEFLEAKALGIHTRPVLLGPVSLLLLGKTRSPDRAPLALIEGLIPVYEELLQRLAAAGADWVQLDEPCLALDHSPEAVRALETTYARFAKNGAGVRRLVATYFAGLQDNLPLALRLPIDGLHLDLVRAPGQLEPALAHAPRSLSLSLGIVDGRNIWRTDLDRVLSTLERAAERLGPDRVLVAPSCSLLHSPLDLDLEPGLDPELRSWLAFASQKVQEVITLASALRRGRDAVRTALAESRAAAETRRDSPRIHDPAVKAHAAAVSPEMVHRSSPYSERRRIQAQALRLPPLPTTTIGSFPQTREIRTARADLRAGRIAQAAYDRFLRAQIEQAIRFQEEIGLDVLVHGEFERSDMIEYFAEQLKGFALTQAGWVQSYGSRCVRPPLLFGDVSRRWPMTAGWTTFAQSLTDRPVKGMLTGPVTLLQWSFVRDDQPRSLTCRQIALALRDEIADLETAGARVIQIDEPAIREGLPLEREHRKQYLGWAVEAFRLATSGVRDSTQIHTHMCYSDFSDIIDAIADLDADVLSIEASRSDMRILDALKRHRYPRDVGPGVYDIHSPHVPSPAEIEVRLERALTVLSPGHLWVNPDCGLKTRRWEEVRPALAAMVTAARTLRRVHTPESRHRDDRGTPSVEQA
jgi:5-methyltetrahydropteroyltriglutamate--homocysteine methyltransferase